MKRNYDDEDFIPWYRRVTPTWLGLSIEARGALVSIAMHLNRATGELPLRKGLPSLAVLLNIPWEKLEPAVAELIAEEKLGWDGSRFVLFDPEHENRRRRTSADRMRDLRAKNKSAESQPPSGNVTPSDACDVRDEHKTDVTGVTPVLSVSSVSSVSSSEADQKSLTGGSKLEDTDETPDWFRAAGGTVEMTTGLKVTSIATLWLDYRSSRDKKGSMGHRDAVGWIASVLRREARHPPRTKTPDFTPKYEQPTQAQSKSIQQRLAERLAAEAKKGAA